MTGDISRYLCKNPLRKVKSLSKRCAWSSPLTPPPCLYVNRICILPKCCKSGCLRNHFAIKSRTSDFECLREDFFVPVSCPIGEVQHVYRGLGEFIPYDSPSPYSRQSFGSRLRNTTQGQGYQDHFHHPHFLSTILQHQRKVPPSPVIS